MPAESQAPKTPELQELPQPGQSSPPKTENTKVEGESAGGAPPEPSITPAIDNNGKPSGSKGSDKEDDLEPKTRKAILCCLKLFSIKCFSKILMLDFLGILS